MVHEVIRAISVLENMRHLLPAKEAEVRAAEKALGLTFAEDYREYVMTYGVISARGIELTGVTSAKRLDVVNVTMTERELSDIPQGMYVLENPGIDGILILQDSSGTVYSIAPHEAVKRVCGSLTEYVSKSNF